MAVAPTPRAVHSPPLVGAPPSDATSTAPPQLRSRLARLRYSHGPTAQECGASRTADHPDSPSDFKNQPSHARRDDASAPPPPAVRPASDGEGPPAASPTFPSLSPRLFTAAAASPSHPPRRAHARLASSLAARLQRSESPAAAMAPSLLGGFTKSLAMTVLSEIGDKTFFAAAILAMRHPRKLVLAGCLSALIVMTALSASLGWAAPNLISRKWTHHITTLLFFVFGIWSLWEGFKEDGDSEELAEVEAELDAAFKSNKGETKSKSKANDDMKKQQRPFLMQFFSPIFIKAFSITFFGEWGDKSQIATIGLAADENPFGVVLGGIIAQALCTTAAVLGGKSLASQISEKMVELSSGVLFLLFGIMSLLSGPEGEL
ncbi:hypothetical protein ACP4OV_031892 [Aristida adscensionis]